ncbi:MAG: glycosyltransferase family 4 protein [Candidatus Magasanikbacteria bacterium]|nr:glycosyltransferase family 4 protein [Candidatus Magasanikbacteria bacterium]
MKIAMIGAKGVPTIFGGVERSVEELSARIVNRGHQVTVYCRSWYTNLSHPEIQKGDAGGIFYRGIRLITTFTIHTKHLDAIVHTFTSTIHALFSDFDVIHFHGVGPALLSWMPRLFKPRAKVFISFQCLDREHEKWGRVARWFLKLGERFACAFGHEVFVSANFLKDYCAEMYNRETVVLPNGANFDPETKVTEEPLASYGLLPQKYILVVTRLVPHKGVHTTIEAYERLKAERPVLVANLKLVIVGDSSFTDEYVELLKQTAAKDTDIVFTGYQSGGVLKSLMAHAAFAVHASNSEGLPMAVIEIMGHGTPILLSDIAPHRELVQGDKIFFAPNDVFALKEKMAAMISVPLEARATGAAMRSAVTPIYSWDLIATRYLVYICAYLPQKSLVFMESPATARQ